MKTASASPLAVTAISLCFGCSPSSEPQSLEPVLLTVPAGPESTGPRLSAGPGNTVILSWMEPDAVDTSLLYSEFSAGHWTDSHTVVSEAPVIVNWADLPSVVPVGDDRLVAHWMSQNPDDVYSYDIKVSQSMNGGDAWSRAVTPHTDNTPTEHGFVSILPMDHKAGLVWLDGRKMINEVTDNPVESGMTLRAAFIDEASAIDVEQLVDELICDCCQTDVAVAASGPLAVYRDRSVDEIRDIYVARFVDGRWQPGQAVAADNWEIAGCPVNGPSIAAHEESVAVTWFTAAGSQPKVKIATSTDSGASFSESLEVISGETLGRVGVALLDDHDVAVSWLRHGLNGSSDVMAVRFRPMRHSAAQS